MKLLTVPYVFALAAGFVGLCYLADAGVFSNLAASGNPAAAVVGEAGQQAGDLMSMAAMADDKVKTNDFSDLLRIGNRRQNDIGPNVSTDVISQRSVTKIGFGRKTNITIFTTSSGTYSTDALASNNVQYPGIDVADNLGGGQSDDQGDRGMRGLWYDSPSVITYTQLPGHGFTRVIGDHACVHTRSFLYCN